ncbi:hypothetical protein Q428_03890 [Fervidicella metallireducens AeB]|uniref:Uncharacterized protein n=1 Tax=Fervidicella metallireducens AeB TaxID=1403537 RepID=A0A017RXD6_9CLOT|nr:hypothetical protein [Fervidicella metallireducens]EYE89256.1 hypothetical protein Q428_03890 [Fervidicella metallireducens AeB]
MSKYFTFTNVLIFLIAVFGIFYVLTISGVIPAGIYSVISIAIAVILGLSLISTSIWIVFTTHIKKSKD